MIAVSHLSAVGIVCRQADPSHIFINMEDSRTAARVFCGALRPLGGVWAGANGSKDKSPIETFCRRVKEEMCVEFKHPQYSGAFETGLMQPGRNGENKNGFSKEEGTMFVELCKAIIAKAKPWQDYLVPVGTDVLQSVDPEARPGFVSLTSYLLCELDEVEWGYLTTLQQRFNNLSRESCSWTTSLQEILIRQHRFAYGHEAAYTDFWLSRGFTTALGLARFQNPTAAKLGLPRSSYLEYLKEYQVSVHP